VALAGQASSEMGAEYTGLGLGMETPRQDRTADVLSLVRQLPLMARTNKATRQYEAIEVRLMGLLSPGLRPGQNGPAEPLAERS
jgi:hypothetical protein